MGNNLDMQYREELSFLGQKARLCSLPTTHCDHFTSSTKPSHIIHVLIQFQIHGAAQLKQSISSSIIEPCQTLLNCLTWVLCILEKILKNTENQFKLWSATTFLEEILIWLSNNDIELQKAAFQHCYSAFFSMIINWCSVFDKTTSGLWDINFHSDVWCDASIQSRKFSGVGDFKASFDEVNFLMFWTFHFLQSLSCSLSRLFRRAERSLFAQEHVISFLTDLAYDLWPRKVAWWSNGQ